MPPLREGRAVYVAQAGEAIVDAAARLWALAAQPEGAALLAPLGRIESTRVGKVVAWIRPLRPADAHRRDGGPGAHEPFLAAWAFLVADLDEPAAFPEDLRLPEARRLMPSTGMDAGLACQRVGYVCASQFSREYARHFGNVPIRDMACLREAGLTGAVPFLQ